MAIARLSKIRARRSKPRRVSVNRDKGYLRFLASEGKCVVRLVSLSHVCDGPIDPCHGPAAGMSMKGPDNEAIPMCRAAHNEQHRLTWKNFELKYGIERGFYARVWYALYVIAKEGGMA